MGEFYCEVEFGTCSHVYRQGRQGKTASPLDSGCPSYAHGAVKQSQLIDSYTQLCTDTREKMKRPLVGGCGLGGLAALLLGLLSLTGVSEAGGRTVVHTPLGTVRGHMMTSRGGRPFLAFSGLPYAKPPIANLRFEVIISSKYSSGGISTMYIAAWGQENASSHIRNRKLTCMLFFRPHCL